MSTRSTIAIGKMWHLYEELATGEIEYVSRGNGVELVVVLPREAVLALVAFESRASDDEQESAP